MRVILTVISTGYGDLTEINAANVCEGSFALEDPAAFREQRSEALSNFDYDRVADIIIEVPDEAIHKVLNPTPIVLVAQVEETRTE